MGNGKYLIENEEIFFTRNLIRYGYEDIFSRNLNGYGYGNALPDPIKLTDNPIYLYYYVSPNFTLHFPKNHLTAITLTKPSKFL